MRNLFALVFVFCVVAIAFAQERLVGKAEFDAMVVNGSNHHVIWKGNKYRMTVTTSSKATGRAQTDWSSKMVFEYGSGAERRSMTTSKFGDKVSPTREALWIGDWTYSRSGSEPWTRKEYTPPEPVQEDAGNATSVLVTNDQYKFQGTGYLKDKPVQIYERTYRRTADDLKSGIKTDSDVRVTYWIDAIGTVVKSEFSSETLGPVVTIRTVVVTEWELDPSITIAAPEVS